LLFTLAPLGPGGRLAGGGFLLLALLQPLTQARRLACRRLLLALQRTPRGRLARARLLGLLALLEALTQARGLSLAADLATPWPALAQ